MKKIALLLLALCLTALAQTSPVTVVDLMVRNDALGFDPDDPQVRVSAKIRNDTSSALDGLVAVTTVTTLDGTVLNKTETRLPRIRGKQTYLFWAPPTYNGLRALVKAEVVVQKDGQTLASREETEEVHSGVPGLRGR
jgi:hypothetical protein